MGMNNPRRGEYCWISCVDHPQVGRVPPLSQVVYKVVSSVGPLLMVTDANGAKITFDTRYTHFSRVMEHDRKNAKKFFEATALDVKLHYDGPVVGTRYDPVRHLEYHGVKLDRSSVNITTYSACPRCESPDFCVTFDAILTTRGCVIYACSNCGLEESKPFMLKSKDEQDGQS